MYLLGYDVGSSFVKASLLDAQTGSLIASGSSPVREMTIVAAHPGWAEQSPELWWRYIKSVTREILAKSRVKSQDVKAIGISYQMHGLVVVDKHLRVLRDAIIWCDSRAVTIGERAFDGLGQRFCQKHLLNSPGNFTASKLKWVKDHEPRVFSKIYKMMLPGDYIAMRMSGSVNTTAAGLSEAILWDFSQQRLATTLLDYYGIPHDLVPDVVPQFGIQETLSSQAAQELGLVKGIAISYRAGDQPNNALSLNVLEPGEVAASAGTSGVVYGVSNQRKYKQESRVNTFLHVNHTPDHPRHGVLLCVNGTGILNSWIKKYLISVRKTVTYETMNHMAIQAPIGSDGLVVLPFGNGAERMLGNKDIGSSMLNLRFNTHTTAHVVRAVQEGIVFSLRYGLDIMGNVGIKATTIRAGYTNIFLSPLFRRAFATVTGVVLQMYNTDGAAGAARGAGYGAGAYKHLKDAYVGLKVVDTVKTDTSVKEEYEHAYQKWRKQLHHTLQIS